MPNCTQSCDDAGTHSDRCASADMDVVNANEKKANKGWFDSFSVNESMGPATLHYAIMKVVEPKRR